jgi:O-antigen/teichoic acid export membrane protein
MPQVLRTGSLMSLSLIVTAFGGLIGWALLARYLNPAQVGVVTGVVNSFILLSSVAQLNLTAGLHRYLPAAGGSSTRLVAGSMATVIVTSVAVAVAYMLSPLRPAGIAGAGVSVAGMAAMTALWSVFALEDQVAAAVGRPSWVPVENGLFSLSRLAVIIALAGQGTLGALVSWWAPVTVCVIVFNICLFVGPLRATRGQAARPLPRREFTGYLAGNYAASILTTLLFTGLPVVVLSVVGPASAGVFGILWVMIQTVQNVAFFFGSSLVISISGGRTSAHDDTRATTVAFAVAVPVIGLGVLLAPLVLRIFGPHYVAAGTTPFRILLVATLFSAVVVLRSSIWRAQGRALPVLGTAAVQAVPAVLLIGALGLKDITSISVLFLASSAVTAAIVLPGLVRELRAPLRRDRTEPSPLVPSEVGS